MAENCIFCRILNGEIPGQFVYRDEQVAAFRDIHAVAPIHILIVPTKHIDSLAAASEEHRTIASSAPVAATEGRRGRGVPRRAAERTWYEATMGRLLLAAAEVARLEGLDEKGYRVVINTGPDSGSEVSHLHLHVLGGRQMRSMG